MMRKNASKKIREMGTFGIYLSSMLRHHRLKLALDTGKMDICNIPTYCSTGESIWLNITPLQLHIFFWNIENICSTFANIFWNICKYFQSHLQTSWNIENSLLRWIFGSVICDMYNSIDVHASTVSLISQQTENYLFRNTKCIFDQITQHIC